MAANKKSNQGNKNRKNGKKQAQQKRAGIIIAVVAVVFIALIVWAVSQSGEGTNGGTQGGSSEADITHYADIEIKGYGTITVALYGNTAPETVKNFVSLAESGFYDGLTFHRIIEGFMMQGGEGGYNKTITGEFSVNGFNNPLTHTRGAISMARSENYDSASSQFFIVQQDSPHLNGKYAAFGYVTNGMEIVDAICEEAEPIDGNGMIAADKQPVITSIKIRKK